MYFDCPVFGLKVKRNRRSFDRSCRNARFCTSHLSGPANQARTPNTPAMMSAARTSEMTVPTVVFGFMLLLSYEAELLSEPHYTAENAGRLSTNTGPPIKFKSVVLSFTFLDLSMLSHRQTLRATAAYRVLKHCNKPEIGTERRVSQKSPHESIRCGWVAISSNLPRLSELRP